MATLRDKQVLVRLYKDQDVLLDHLPYTSEFEHIWEMFNNETKRNMTRHEVWKTLMFLRKNGDLGKKTNRRHYIKRSS